MSVTELLGRWKSGDNDAGTQLINQIYPMLRNLARSQVRRFGGALTLRPTELAHEAYERINEQQGVDWRNRDHFLAIASTLLRRVAIDYLRARSSDKRGGGLAMQPLDDIATGEAPSVKDCTDWLATHDALTELAAMNVQYAQVVELKVFAGLSNEQVAAAMGISRATVVRHWRFARAWLAERLDAHGVADGEGC